MRKLLITALAAGALAVPAVPGPVAQADPYPACGPDQAASVDVIRARVRHDPFTFQPYDPVPVASNYDPCANLSAILLRGTVAPSPPIAVFLFNRGRYIGTPYESRPYTGLNVAASTKDVVVVDFADGRSCDTCHDGTTTPVRYLWNGTSVVNLDIPPRTPLRSG